MNISIRDGARIEIKGVQDLDSMPLMVENEVKRQLKLLKIREKLQERKAHVEEEIYYLEEIFRGTESDIIKMPLKRMERF